MNAYVENGIIKIVFVKSIENDSNILTKNLSVELHEKHSKKMVGWNFKMFLASKIFELIGRVVEMMF